MKRINLVTDGISPHVIGGMQRHSKNLLEVFLRLGVEVHLIHPRLGEVDEGDIRHSIEAESNKLQINLVDWPRRSFLPGGYVLENWLYSRTCYQVINEDPKFRDAPVIAKGFTGLKMVKRHPVWINLHGYEMFQRQFSFRGWLASLWLRLPVRFLHAHCEGYFSYGTGITRICEESDLDRNNHIEIPGGVDVSWLSSSDLRKLKDNEIRKFVFVGRNERRKALLEIKAAWELLPETSNRLLLIGPHDSNQWHEMKNVDVLGEIKDARELMTVLDHCDVLVCPSYSEGMPNVIMEGMARGLAILATDVGAVKALVNEDNGVLLESVSVEGIVQALNHFNSMPASSLNSMRINSQEKIQSFTWSSLEAEYDRFLAQIFA
jgi:glycosyltransferase involved in cell wall biosynthesis